MRRGGCHHHEVVGHTSVQRERADGERLQCLVGLRYGDVVEPHIEWCVGFWVILHPKPTLQRTDGVDDPLEVHVLGVGAATRQPLRGKGDDQGESESRGRAEAETENKGTGEGKGEGVGAKRRCRDATWWLMNAT